MMTLSSVPPSAIAVELGFSGLCVPKLMISVVSRVTTLFESIQSRIRSLFTKRPKPNILATASILYTADHTTPQRPMPAKKLDDAVGVNMDMTHLQLADDIYVAPIAAAHFWRGLIGHANLELGAFVEGDAYEMLEGFGTADLADAGDNTGIANPLHAVGRRAGLGFQEPVENRQLGAVFPAAHGNIRLVVLPHSEKDETAQ